MNKEEAISYLNSISKYINLSAICKLYNSLNVDSQIDYNNLRVVINRQHIGRLSEEKLNKFISFLYTYLYVKILKVSDNTVYSIDYSKIDKLVQNFSSTLKETIKDELGN